MAATLLVSLAVTAALVVGLAAGAALAWAVAAGRLRREPRVAAGALGALVEHAPDLVLGHRVDGTDLELNAAARAALGLGEAGGAASLLDAVALDDRPAARAHLATLADEGVARTDLRLRATGRVFELVSQRAAGRAITVGRDVDARAERERRALAARDRARADARDKSTFLDSMSHDLRTPLTAVLGFAELLRDEVDAESRGLVQAIETGGRRLLQTLDGVLDLARLDAGRARLHPAPTDVVAVVEGAVARYRAAAEDAGLTLTVESVSPSVPATLDPDLVDRVVGTLVDNAVAFTRRGGVTVEVVDDASAVTLRVLDTGPGIAPDLLPTMFSEHRRQPGAEAERPLGMTGPVPVGVTALGLAVARRLVDLAGGSVSVESRWGQGSAFTVVLPRGPIPELGAPARAEPPAAGLVEAVEA